MSKEEYGRRLRDPRWQQRRLRALSAAHWQCQACAERTMELHVHHLRYYAGRMPWDYDDQELVVLCSECHGYIHRRLGAVGIRFDTNRAMEETRLIVSSSQKTVKMLDELGREDGCWKVDYWARLDRAARLIPRSLHTNMGFWCESLSGVAKAQPKRIPGHVLGYAVRLIEPLVDMKNPGNLSGSYIQDLEALDRLLWAALMVERVDVLSAIDDKHFNGLMKQVKRGMP